MITIPRATVDEIIAQIREQMEMNDIDYKQHGDAASHHGAWVAYNCCIGIINRVAPPDCNDYNP